MKFLINRLLNNFGYQITKTKSKPTFNVSYSQCGEDIIVHYVFKLRGIDYPSYIDIGANHPYSLSNTALFYNIGCRGINIEANPMLIKEFELNRHEDQNINIGIGPIDEELDFYIINDPTLSTFSKDEADNITAIGKYSIKNILKVRLTSIEKILDKYYDGKFPDFLSLDVEGLDFDILKSINFSKYWPKIICVEAAEYSPRGDGKRKQDIIDFLLSKGYFEYANTNLNAIMVKTEFWNS